MPHIQTTIGHGLVQVQVEYDITDDDTQGLSVEVQSVDLYASAADKSRHSRIDVSGLLTESVFASLEHDCRAHELSERKRMAEGDGYAKQTVLAHYRAQAALAGAV